MLEKKIYAPGIYDITNEQYHSSAGISRSGVMEFKRSPKHYWYKYLNPNYVSKPQTAAMIFGSALHCYILEPEKFKKEYAISKNFDKRTTAGKQAYAQMLAESAGKMLIDQSDFEIILGMAESVNSDPQAKGLITDAQYEKSIYWTDEETGLLCKCRPDIMHENFIVDLKSTLDASPKAFQRSFYGYGYALQLGMIHEGIKAVTGKSIFNFIDLAVEKDAPFCPAIYPIDEYTLQFGIDEFHYYLLRMKECFDSNQWPSYATQTISLPAYATIGE